VAELTNSFEGGSDGVAITQGSGGNSGGASGDFWDSVVNAPTFSNVQAAHGSLSGRIFTTSAGTKYLAWAGSLSVGADWYGRMYWHLNALTSASWSSARYLEIRSSAGLACFIRPATTGNAHYLELANAAGSIAATGTVGIPGNQWIRLEWHLVHSATVGSLEVRMWTTMDSTGSPTDTVSFTNNDTSTDLANIRVGATTSQANFPISGGYLYIDDPLVGAATWPGPVGGVVQLPAPPIRTARPLVPVLDSYTL
jgi:hypothetical protein